MAVITTFDGSGAHKAVRFRGLSIDDKPMTSKHLRQGLSTFTETDTGSVYTWQGNQVGWSAVSEPQKASTETETLKARVNTLEDEHASLRSRIDTLENR